MRAGRVTGLSVRALLAGPCAVTESAKYLLRAPAPMMRSWKLEAERRGLTFAEFCRRSLELAVIDRIWDSTSLVEAAAAEAEGPDGAAASTGGASLPGSGPMNAAVPAVPPVDCSGGPADLVQTPAGPPASPELTVNRPDLIDEARRLAARMRV